MRSWLVEQVEMQVASWSSAVERFYPETAELWSIPEKHVQALHEKWNLLEAAQRIEWKRYVDPAGSRCLDLGCGTGWLSALVSTIPGVDVIDAVDSDRQNLEEMLPTVVPLLGGDLAKIEPTLGLFSPLPVPDDHYDLIMASAALHHADNLYPVLRELRRVLREGGTLVIVNETPYSRARYAARMMKDQAKGLARVLARRTGEHDVFTSATGILADPYLGDHIYSWYHWDQALRAAGFSYEAMRTGLAVQKDRPRAADKLAHFVCS